MTAARRKQSYVTPAGSGRKKLHKTGERRRDVVEECIIAGGRRPFQTVTYRRELVSCGKSRCGRCAGKAAKHGPYWYAYWKDNGRTRSKYIGKHLKVETSDAQRARRRDAERAR